MRDPCFRILMRLSYLCSSPLFDGESCKCIDWEKEEQKILRLEIFSHIPAFFLLAFPGQVRTSVGIFSGVTWKPPQ